jgi:hypothetical protein
MVIFFRKISINSINSKNKIRGFDKQIAPIKTFGKYDAAGKSDDLRHTL